MQLEIWYSYTSNQGSMDKAEEEKSMRRSMIHDIADEIISWPVGDCRFIHLFCKRGAYLFLLSFLTCFGSWHWWLNWYKNSGKVFLDIERYANTN